MIIRLLTQKDIVEHDKISSQAFSYACDIHAPDSVLPCDKMLGAFDDDDKTLFADLEIHERKCNYDGVVLTCAAVGGVAAKPEHRGKGAVRALFQHIFSEERYDVSILYPFSEEYYRKYGYERVGNSLSVTVPFSDLSAIRRNQDVNLFEGDDTQRLLAIYNTCARQYTLSFVREDAQAFSDRPYLSQQYTYIWKDNSYATISVDRAKSTIFVRELYFDSCASMLGIVGFLRSFESNQKYVCFQNLPAASPLLYHLPDLKNCEIKMYNTGSARVLDFERVLKAHRYPQDGAFTVRIGNENFAVAHTADRVEVTRGSRQEPDAVMDVHTASGVLLSGLTDAEYRPGLAIRKPDSDFLRSFPPKTVFFTDPF